MCILPRCLALEHHIVPSPAHANPWSIWLPSRDNMNSLTAGLLQPLWRGKIPIKEEIMELWNYASSSRSSSLHHTSHPTAGDKQAPASHTGALSPIQRPVPCQNCGLNPWTSAWTSVNRCPPTPLSFFCLFLVTKSFVYASRESSRGCARSPTGELDWEGTEMGCNWSSPPRSTRKKRQKGDKNFQRNIKAFSVAITHKKNQWTLD